MSALNDAKTKNVLEQPHQQRKDEPSHGIQDTVESSQKDKQRKRHEKKKASSSSSSSSTASSSAETLNRSSNVCNTSLGRQFSVQRTDSDGCLRMKISAIRPISTLNAAPAKAQIIPCPKTNSKESNSLQVESIKLKISPPPPPPKDKRTKVEDRAKLPSNMSVMISSSKDKNELPLPLLPSLSHTSVAHGDSDVTDSGCSEATNTTSATAGLAEKSLKRKFKRKKSLIKGIEAKRSLKSLKAGGVPENANSFSTDSEDEPLAQKLIPNVAALTQRAPRLLLTAVGSKAGIHSGSATGLSTKRKASDHIGVSSSDNEAGGARARIEGVTADSDDEDQVPTSHFYKAKTKPLPQYQSTLLQDFGEKLQTQSSKCTSSATLKSMHNQHELFVHLNTNSQSDSIASSAASVNKKRRGRPKKPEKLEQAVVHSMSPLQINKISNINESGDSGVISTTSISTQSTSPHPCTTLASSLCNENAQLSQLSPSKTLASSPEKQSHDTSVTLKPKIDIALLDKRMYATERVLYPPPRNKRRQSMSAASLPSAADKRPPVQNTTKDDMQLDPVWRKIDVNRKFRRPSVCSTTGYKSDGGLVDDRVRDRPSKSTVCSKVLAAKSGYVSDYGSSSFRVSRNAKHAHNSGYKSDASCKSRYSTKSCSSRKSRAKSCGYRSDCKDSVVGLGTKSSKFRRKRRASIVQKSMGSLKDEQDILQLAGLSLGQSSEESNEYVCKPSLEKLPTTSASKKYGEINRYIATGEYFGRGSSGNHSSTHKSFASLSNSNASKIFDLSATQLTPMTGKLTLHQRKNSTTSEFAHELLQLPGSQHGARKIKSRRSSVASYCSSFYSVGTTKMRKRRKKKLFRLHSSSSSKNAVVDSKLLTEIEILTNTFSSRCRIHSGGNDKHGGANLTQKEKLMAEATRLQQSLAAAAAAQASTSVTSGKRDSRDKKSLKKRKMSENLDFAMLSARAESSSTAPSATGQGTSSKRRHKKASSSSPDDHKLPLKKRHYLLTPGEKSSEVAVAVAAKLFANNAEAWAAAAAAAKTTANTKSQQQFNAKNAKANLTPKKRHLLQQHPHSLSEDSNSNKTSSTLSPLRVAVGDSNSISGGKLLDISPQSLNSLKQVTEAVYKKRSRLEGLVSRIATNHSEEVVVGAKNKSLIASSLQIESESSSCPPPGVFEPSVELEIQIPPITKLSDATAGIIAKSEVESPLLIDLNKGYTESPAQKTSGQKVVESLLNKTGGNLLLKRKRKKINRTGFPTVRRKKRKIQESSSPNGIYQEVTEVEQHAPERTMEHSNQPSKQCDRVPHEGETSNKFLERNNKTPRLSVVALERLQESPMSSKDTARPQLTGKSAEPTTPKSRHGRRDVQKKIEPEGNKSPSELKGKSLTKESRNTDSKKIPPSVKAKKVGRPKEGGGGGMTKPATTKAAKHSLASKMSVSNDEDDDRPLASRAKRTKYGTDSLKRPPMEQRQAPKSGISKTVKSLLDANIKLPAGIDPNSLMSCKIKLKRRNSIHPLSTAMKGRPVNTIRAPLRDVVRTPEEIDMDAESKDCNIDYEEHDVLPMQESLFCMNGDTEGSDTSEEKSSTNSCKRSKMIKKSYLPAGLFSDYFKTNQAVRRKLLSKREQDKKTDVDKLVVDFVADAKDPEVARPQLPPPPYCERYLRRTKANFELPYDIWWAYKNSKLPSRITVASWNFRKIRTNMYAENVKPAPIAANDHPMCNCKPDAGCGDNCLNRMVYTECSPTNCPAYENCRNQKIQRHEIAPGVERFMTENKGWGVRTKLKVAKGTYILEYVGEVVTEREFKDRMATIYLNDTHHYCLHLDGGLVIDGHRMGSDCRFVNHSCEPNCEIQKWSVNGLSRMALFAKRNIEEGEELTYDYNFSLFNPSEGQPCRCNTPNCRGVIGGKSQRVKPLPIESKAANDTAPKDDHKCRQRKRKAKKNTQRQASKDVTTPTRMQALSDKEKKLVKQYSIFLVRNFEKIRSKKTKQKKANKMLDAKTSVSPGSSTSSTPNISGTPAAINQRRPSTPASLAAQITALCTARNIKTRGLTLAVQDPELEKMAKMAKILRDICTNIELVEIPECEGRSLLSIVMSPLAATSSANKKKKATMKSQQKCDTIDFRTIQNNIEQGFYKSPEEFNTDMLKVLAEAKRVMEKSEPQKLHLVDLLEKSFDEEKQKQYSVLLDVLGNAELLKGFTAETPQSSANEETPAPTVEAEVTSLSAEPALPEPHLEITVNSNEDIIRCICGLYRDEGLMIQCARCMVWQHTECTKADVKADNYLCEKCEPRNVDREIPLEDFTEEGHRYYLTLMRGEHLQVRQGDAVYVLRDIPIRDDAGNVVPSQKHTYETIGQIDYNECDIFRVERLWKDDQGNRFIFGHHFLRPHETFHEPSRRFYPNEVVRVPLYEVVPINLVIGRCWVLDRTTFCKGRPIDCTEETHCFICELRVDKSARFFSKTKTSHPTCTKSYAFRKFNEKLRISKTYAPHDVNPAMLKTKKQKTEIECQNMSADSLAPAGTSSAATLHKQESSKIVSTPTKKRQYNKSPGTLVGGPGTDAAITISANTKDRRSRLEDVLKQLKKRCKLSNSAISTASEPPLDLTYLLTGRGARLRKTPIKKDFV